MNYVIIKKSPSTEIQANLSIEDQAIPDEVKNHLVNNKTRHITVAEHNGILWIASKLKVKQINLSNYREFEVCYMKPAKGSGFVAIQAWPIEKGQACAVILEFGTYTEQALAYAKQAAEELELVLGYKLKLSYWGTDC